MKHHDDGLFTILTHLGEPFLHRSRFTRGVLGALDVVGVPGAGTARDLLSNGGGAPAVSMAVDRCGIPAFRAGESQATSEARFRCANPVSPRGTLEVNLPFTGGPGVGVGFSAGPTEVGTEVGEVGSGGQPVIGSFDMPAMTPVIVGAVMDHHGVLKPIRRCRAGVLGKDNLCYMKIPNSFRKWPKAARAPVSASDAKCIRRAASSVKRVERLAKSVGLKTSKRR